MKNLEKRIENEVVVGELFSGCGLTSIGVENACNGLGLKMQHEFFGEIDRGAITAFRLLHGDEIPNVGDITRASFGKYACDILLCTSPCTSLSNVGKREGMSEGSGSASSTIWEIRRIINEMPRKPRVLFFENVKAMVGERFKHEFALFKAFLESEGYFVFYKVLNAKDYGVPQNRERVFIIACLDKVDFEWPKKEELNIFLKDILESDPDSKYFKVIKDYFIKHSLRDGYLFRVHNPSHAYVAHTITTKSGSRTSDNFVFGFDVSDDHEVRFNDKGLANYDLEELKDVPIRKLTRRETMLLMGLNEEEIGKLKPMSDTQIFKLMGNGIVIPLVEKVFYKFLEAYMAR